MEMNEMLSLCKKACNEQDDCKNCPNKEKCDDISEIYTLANLIDENYEFSEEAIIDFYNGFFPEEKVKKENKENKKTDTDDNNVAYVSFYSAAQKILKVNKKTVGLLDDLHEIGVLNDFRVFESIDEFLIDACY